jgi:hypothetical protein
MTTPPACCAGADDGKIHPQSCLFRCAERGAVAAADSSADDCGVGAVADTDVHLNAYIHADADTDTHAFAESFTVPKPNAYPDVNTDHRFGFQRRIDHRSGQAAL